MKTILRLLTPEGFELLSTSEQNFYSIGFTIASIGVIVGASGLIYAVFYL